MGMCSRLCAWRDVMFLYARSASIKVLSKLLLSQCAAVRLLSFAWHDGLLKVAMFLQCAGLTLVGVAVLLNTAAAIPPPQLADHNAVFSYNLSSSVTPCRQVSSND